MKKRNKYTSVGLWVVNITFYINTSSSVHHLIDKWTFRFDSTECVNNLQIYRTQRYNPLLVGQLSTWKWHYCAVSVKSVRFGRECKQSINNIFLICHVLWHFQDGRHWPWELHMGQKLKKAPISLKTVSNYLVCHKDWKK